MPVVKNHDFLSVDALIIDTSYDDIEYEQEVVGDMYIDKSIALKRIIIKMLSNSSRANTF